MKAIQCHESPSYSPHLGRKRRGEAASSNIPPQVDGHIRGMWGEAEGRRRGLVGI